MGLKKLDEKEGPARQAAIDELREVVLPKELTVTGIFETGHYLHDSEFILVPVHIGQELYDLGDALHGLTVRTVDPYARRSVKHAIERFLTPPEYAQTWIDMNNQYFEAVRLERTVMFFLLFFIVVVAAFGIMSTLITVTVQKTREIGIMKAIGANIWQIVWVFLAQGMVVGLFGTLTGLGLGMTLIRYRNEFSQWLSSTFGIEVFPRQVYQFSQIPAEVIPSDVAKICVIAFIICSLAALVAGLQRRRGKDPVESVALRVVAYAHAQLRFFCRLSLFCCNFSFTRRLIASPASRSPRARKFLARHGMVCTSVPAATQVGLDVLKRGGNAIDAAIAANATLGLMEPVSNGIGGDLFAIVYSAKENKLYGLNASGRSPLGLSYEQMKAELAKLKRDDHSAARHVADQRAGLRSMAGPSCRKNSASSR